MARARATAGAADFNRQVEQFHRDLTKALSPKAIAEEFVKRFGAQIIKMVIAAAKAGIGPGDKRYPEYAASYRKQLGLVAAGGVLGFSRKLAKRFWATGKGGKRRAEKARAAGMKQWLTLTGHMLSPKNFSWEIGTSGGLALVWTAPDHRTGIYGEVHNAGLPIGKGGPRKQREWMHFDASMTRAAVEKAMEETVDTAGTAFAARWGGRSA